jgi:ATP-dependent DNA ligase
MFFDLFNLDGRGLTGLKLTQRKEMLDKLLQKSKPGGVFAAQ